MNSSTDRTVYIYIKKQAHSLKKTVGNGSYTQFVVNQKNAINDLI